MATRIITAYNSASSYQSIIILISQETLFFCLSNDVFFVEIEKVEEETLLSFSENIGKSGLQHILLKNSEGKIIGAYIKKRERKTRTRLSFHKGYFIASDVFYEYNKNKPQDEKRHMLMYIIFESRPLA